MAENTKQTAMAGSTGAEAELDMDQKHAYVREWLEKVFTGEEVPDYEINSQTIDCLYRMARQNETREREAEILMEDFEQKTEEYAAETARLQSVMNWLGFSTADLTPAGQSYVNTLVGTAMALDLRDCSDTSLCLALTDLSQRLSSAAVKVEEEEREGERVERQMRASLLREAAHRRALDELSKEAAEQAPTLAKQKKESEFLKQKTKQYHKLVASMKEELTQSGYEPGLSHGTLQQCAKEVEALQSQLEPLQAQLASYQGLPPDLNLAKVKVEEAKQELAKLEAELARTIDLVHAEK